MILSLADHFNKYYKYKGIYEIYTLGKIANALPKFCLPFYILYVQEVVTPVTVCPGSSDPPDKYQINLHQKIRFTPFF